MAFALECPKCRKRYQTAQDMTGQRVKCAACGESFVAAAPNPTARPQAGAGDGHSLQPPPIPASARKSASIAAAPSAATEPGSLVVAVTSGRAVRAENYNDEEVKLEVPRELRRWAPVFYLGGAIALVPALCLAYLRYSYLFELGFLFWFFSLLSVGGLAGGSALRFNARRLRLFGGVALGVAVVSLILGEALSFVGFPVIEYVIGTDGFVAAARETVWHSEEIADAFAAVHDDASAQAAAETVERLQWKDLRSKMRTTPFSWSMERRAYAHTVVSAKYAERAKEAQRRVDVESARIAADSKLREAYARYKHEAWLGMPRPGGSSSTSVVEQRSAPSTRGTPPAPTAAPSVPQSNRTVTTPSPAIVSTPSLLDGLKALTGSSSSPTVRDDRPTANQPTVVFDTPRVRTERLEDRAVLAFSFKGASGDGLDLLRAQLLLDDEDNLKAAVRWCPAMERAASHVHWGFAAEEFQGAAPANLQAPSTGPSKLGSQRSKSRPRHSDLFPSHELQKLTGDIGKWIGEGLKSRFAAGVFGDWGKSEHESFFERRGITLLGVGQRSEAFQAAAAHRLDVLLLATVVHKRVAGGKQDSSLRLSLWDVPAGKLLWQSKSVSNSQIAAGRNKGKDPGAELVDAALEYVDENVALTEFPVSAKSAIEARAEALGTRDVYDPLAALVELRGYELHGLLPQERARSLYAAILGEKSVALFLSDDSAERYQALEPLLPKP